jgi:hypothetical protein
MKLKFTHVTLKSAFLTAAVVAALPAHAGFQYNPRDLVIGFRVDGGGTSELTVNAGPASAFYTLASGSTITISSVNATLLNGIFGDMNNLVWSAAADVRTNGDASYPLDTLWLTAPRTDLATQSTPWNRRSLYAQATTGAKIDGIANGGVTYGGEVPTSSTNTSSLVVLPAGNTYAYSTFITASGNYGGTFPGSVESYTGPTFTTDGLSVRADLYQLLPGTGAGTYLGYFELKPTGVLTYTSGSSGGGGGVPRPTITGVTRTNTTTTVSFSTTAGGTYSLHYTNGAGLLAPISQWPVAGLPVSGDGTTKSISDTSTDDQRFYGVSAH